MLKAEKFDPSLYLVTDRTLTMGRELIEIVEQAVKGGVTMVQLREKNCQDKEFYNLGLKLKELLAESKVPLIINDRIDIALAVGADGVHLGYNDIPVDKAREILGDSAIIGLSVESFRQVEAAEKYNVDYIGISPVFSTPTKTDTVTEWGIDGIKRIRSISRHKLVAIGGIKPENTSRIIKAGADGIAVVSAICSAEDPFKSAVVYREMIENGKQMLR